MGEKPEFPSKSFRITVPKMLVGETFCAVFQKDSSSDKVFCRKGKRGEKEDFTSKSCCVTVTKMLVWEAFCAVFKKLRGSENVYG